MRTKSANVVSYWKTVDERSMTTNRSARSMKSPSWSYATTRISSMITKTNWPYSTSNCLDSTKSLKTKMKSYTLKGRRNTG